MSDTPATDKEEFPCMTWPKQDHPMVVRSSLARKLERERDEARFDLAFRRDLYKLQEARVLELEAEVKLWKENATSNKDTFNEMLKERDEAIRSCHIWRKSHSKIVDDRDDWKSFAVKLENAFEIENDALRKQLATVTKQNNERLTLLQENGLAEYGN